eukprot:gene18649-biopygen24253
MQPSCQTCSKPFEPVGGDPARLPLVLDCMCVFCRGCAGQHEAEHNSSTDNGGGGEGVGGIPCLRCKKLRTTPLADLLPSLPHIDAAVAKAANASKSTPAPPPTCDLCENDEATKYCGDCLKNKFFCDGCFASSHKSAKKKSHTSTPIQEHLQQSAGPSPGHSASAAPQTCRIHPDEALKFFCDTCGILVCATCGILEHNGHDLKAMEQVSGEHKDAIAAEMARTVVSRDEVVAAKTGLEKVCDQVRQNGEAAKEKVILGFRRVMAEGKQRSEALVAKVDEAVRFKCGLLEAQVTGTDKSSDNATNGIELAEATLKVASPTQVLQYKKVLVGGLQRFQNHGLALKQSCGPVVDVLLGDALDDIMTQIGTLGVLRTMDTDPAASTAAGEGLAVANVGGIAAFVVTAVEFMSGNVRTTGGDDVKVMLVVVEGGGSGGGAAAAAAAKPASGKRKRSGGGSSGKGRATKKSKTGAAASSAPAETTTTVVDNGDGTYSCSYTPPDGADAVGGGKWQLEVLLNGKPIVGSPFAVEVRPSADMTNWAFGSVATGQFVLREGGAVATKIKDGTWTGVIADGAGCTPMSSGIHYWELEVVKNDDNDGHWCFGVCRPGIDLDDGTGFHRRDDTWVMRQSNTPGWSLRCSTCAGTGMTFRPKPMLPAGSRTGLLLDLDNGGTLTMYWQGKPCGTVAEGLVGPLLPCMASFWKGKTVKIHGGLAPPQ